MHTSKFRYLLPLALLVPAFLAACNGRSVDTEITADYRVEGGLVQDMNVDSVFAVAVFNRNDSNLVTASIKLGADSLRYNDPLAAVSSTYFFGRSSASRYAGDNPALTLKDATRFADTLAESVVDTFRITNFVPPTHIVQGNEAVSLEWTASANAEAYVLAAVKSDAAYTGEGYSLYAPLSAVAGTIPPDAFLLEGTNNPDTGLYNVYVYALSGVPDSALTEPLLPVPLPNQLADNISVTSLTGRFGSIMVAVKDTVRVSQQ